MSKKRIYLYANFGPWNRQPYGGGEVGNRRTLALLRKTDYEVVPISKYTAVPDHKPWNMILLVVRISCHVVSFFFRMLFSRRRCAIFHYVGFYGPMLNFEYMQLSIVKSFGYRIVYEMRGGGAEWFYQNSGDSYRKKFSKLLNKADYIFSQGQENERLVHMLVPGKRIFYYPNYVMDDFYPSECPKKPDNRINLVYFGRLSKSKNVDMVIDVLANLHDKYDNIFLSIIGNYQDLNYYNLLCAKVEELGLSSLVEILPACNHEELKRHLFDKHFYIFPTKEPREGHSNAMTEAMAWGVIPVATPQGFNRSVLCKDDLIVRDLSSNAFAYVVDSVVSSGLIKRYANDMYDRVGSLYTESRAFDNLHKEYDSLFNLI